MQDDYAPTHSEEMPEPLPVPKPVAPPPPPVIYTTFRSFTNGMEHAKRRCLKVILGVKNPDEKISHASCVAAYEIAFPKGSR